MKTPLEVKRAIEKVELRIALKDLCSVARKIRGNGEFCLGDPKGTIIYLSITLGEVGSSGRVIGHFIAEDFMQYRRNALHDYWTEAKGSEYKEAQLVLKKIKDIWPEGRRRLIIVLTNEDDH